MLDLFYFLYHDTSTTEIYTLSLHDALPIFQGREYAQPDREIAAWTLLQPILRVRAVAPYGHHRTRQLRHEHDRVRERDRKSTRLNSSHSQISYAVFCLKKKNHYFSQ